MVVAPSGAGLGFVGLVTKPRGQHQTNNTSVIEYSSGTARGIFLESTAVV